MSGDGELALVLFIGGAQDGQRHPVPDGFPPHINFGVPSDDVYRPPEGPDLKHIKFETYLKCQIEGESGFCVYVYCHEQLSVNGLLRRLVFYYQQLRND